MPVFTPKEFIEKSTLGDAVDFTARMVENAMLTPQEILERTKKMFDGDTKATTLIAGAMYLHGMLIPKEPSCLDGDDQSEGQPS